MKKRHPIRHHMLRFLLILLSAAVAIWFIVLLWYFNRPLPEPVANQVLFEGITYTRVVESDKPLIYHVIRIDLNADGIAFQTTAADEIEGFVYEARTTGQFLEEFGVQVAINGDFFDPWRDYGPLDYYPHVGDGVNVRGLTIAEGVIVTEGYAPQSAFATLYITSDNQASFVRPENDIHTAISGNTMVVTSGQYNPHVARSDYLDKRHPRTAIALDETGNTLFLFVIDGRQPSYSRGVTMAEFASIIIANGGYNALNLDGGGSATLVVEGANGQAQQLGAAIHTHIPYRQRPIANHFGVYAHPLE